MSDPAPDPPKQVFTKEQRTAIRRIATGVVAGATAGIVALAVATIQPQINSLNSRVDALEASASAAPSPTVSPTPSPTASPTASPTRSPTASPTVSPTVSPTASPTVAPSPPATPPPVPVVMPGPEPTGPGGGVFSVVCNFDHRAPNDPIVFFNQPNAAHQHDFFGHIGTNSTTTVGTLPGSATTCEHPADSAAYWAPSLVRPDGSFVQPRQLIIYYQAGHAVRALPQGLVILALATSSAKSGWGCTDNSLESNGSTPDFTCPSGSIRMHVHLPFFWSGKALDSPDHQSHMSFVKDAAHPIEVVHVHMHVNYGISSCNGCHLAPNPNSTLPIVHADMMNGWDQQVLENIIAECVNAGLDCKKNTSAGL